MKFSFLMHRVELKGAYDIVISVAIVLFLMHRVELKVKEYPVVEVIVPAVPNAPCGVESIGLALSWWNKLSS